MQPFWPRHSLWSRSHLRLSERRLLAIILHISVRELERQLLSQPALLLIMMQAIWNCWPRGGGSYSFFVFRWRLSTIFLYLLPMITVLVADCAIVLPICRKTTCRPTVAVVVAKMELLRSIAAIAAFRMRHFIVFLGRYCLQLGLDLVAGCNLISDRLSLIMSAVAKRIARYTLY